MLTPRMTMVLALAIAPFTLQGQTARGEVGGAVYDSIVRAPVAGAMIQMTAAQGPALYHAVADARGRYVIADVVPGRYLIGFQHPALDTLILESPVKVVDVRAGERARVDLAVPAPASIIRQVCRTSPGDSLGLLRGTLRDTRSVASPADTGGIVTVQWNELVIDSAGLRTFERSTSAPVSGEGWFGLCGIPVGTDVLVRAIRHADSSGFVVVTVPAHGIVRRDLAIGGVATVRGRITSRELPVPNARIAAAGSHRAAFTDSSGAFRLADVAAGTQTIETRALGYSPEARLLVLENGTETMMDVELTTVKRVLDTIQVLARRVYSADMFGFERRRRAGGGTFFDEDLVRRRSPHSVMQLLYTIPSLRIIQAGLERSVVMRGGNGFTFQPCAPAFFLDGVRMPNEFLADLDLFVRPAELSGMEVYRGNQAPAEFMTMDGCGAVVVWTQRPRGRR